VQCYGKTKSGKQRFRCNRCGKTYVWNRLDTKKRQEKEWFKLWVTESYSIRQLARISGHSEFKLKLIKNYWLQTVPGESFDYSQYKYLIFDGTYFHKKDCFIIMMDAESREIILGDSIDKESYQTAYPRFKKLKEQGLEPTFVTMDGHRYVIQAFKEVWPRIKIQRCLYHIQREGMRWLRTYPKTEAGRELRRLLAGVCNIKTVKERDDFTGRYRQWRCTHRSFVQSLPRSIVAYKDLKKTMALIDHALPDMFYYLADSRVPSTTNLLEGFYSRLKADFRRHRGLSDEHKKAYLQWYCCFHNQSIYQHI
jgi:transposase-like protein